MQRETVFHAFMNCFRLHPFFRVLENIFNPFNVIFTPQVFIPGFTYKKKERFKCHLITFILGQAKMAIYITIRNKLTQNTQYDVTKTFLKLVKTRIIIDFNFYKSMRNLEMFKLTWCYKEAVCSVLNDELPFTLLCD